MKKKYMPLFLAAVMLFLTACGSSSYVSQKVDNGYYAGGGYAAEEMVPEATMAASISDAVKPNGATTPQADARKWIVTVNLRTETNDLDAMMESVMNRVAELDGYVENQSIYNGSGNYSYHSRNAELTLRIPADRADQFVTYVSGQSNVVSNNRSVQDITLRYVSTENRVKALQAEEDRLLELMEQAQDMSDLLEIESRLTDIRYELENVSSSLRVMANQVDYATVYLSIDEVKEYTPVAPKTFLERIHDGFLENLDDLKENAEDFTVWFISSLPTIAVWVVIISLVLIVIRKNSQKKKQRRMEQWNRTQQERKEQSENQN